MIGIFSTVSLFFVWLINGEDHDTTRINFGSCVWPDAPQNIWKAVIERNPDLWIWAGDATYLDYKNFDMFSDWDVWKQLMWYHFQPGDPNDFQEIWKNTYENSDYKILEKMCPVIGVWDDHDYGVNNGDHFNPHKNLTQELFLDFLNVPKDKNNYKRKRDGVYDFYKFNVTFEKNKNINQLNSINKSIDIILLDIRSHWGENKNNEYDMLGETQWKWLENIINNELTGDLTIIVSGIQILSKNKPYCEQWGTNHYSQERLLTYLLSNHKGNKLFYDHTILLTGDQHWGEISHVTCISQDNDKEFLDKHSKNKKEEEEEEDKINILSKNSKLSHGHHSKYRPTRDLYEITSSGLTHSLGDDAPFFLRTVTKFYKQFETDQITQCMFNNKNFGEIEISWDPKFQENSDNNEIIDYVIDDIFLKIYDEYGNEQCKIKYPLYDHSLIEFKEEELLEFKDNNRLLYQVDTSKYDGIYSKYHCYSFHPISDTMVFIKTYFLLAALIVTLFLPFVFLSTVPCSCYYYYFYCKKYHPHTKHTHKHKHNKKKRH